MKKLTSILSLKALAGIIMLNLIAVVAIAQDSTASSTTTTTTVSSEEVWYVQPWAWVAGGIVLLIILISLFRGKSTGNTTDSVTYTKRVKREEDI